MSKLSHSDTKAMAALDAGRAIDDGHTIMVAVKSGTMRAVGYDEDTDTLIIQFLSGLYTFDAVPEHIHTGLMAAESKGKYFGAHIRGKFQSTKIPVAPREIAPATIPAMS